MTAEADQLHPTEIALSGLHTDPPLWDLNPAASWTFTPAGSSQPAVMSITKVGKAKTKPVRRLSTYAVLSDHRWTEAVIDLRVRSDEPAEKKGRDVCIVLGYVDDFHYTYVHLSNDADGRAHNIIMKVEGDTRRTIHTPAKPEARLTGDQWHDLRIQFDQRGRIAVYHGSMETPLMTAAAPDIVGKPIGVGSFNDRASFTGITIKGKNPER
ncbi:MAG: hypothetical protein R6V45_07700 [Oceanipulchritudo sp.]